MHSLHRLLLSLFLAMSFLPAFAAGESPMASGVWRLVVEDRNPHRELAVLGLRQGADGKTAVRARYGWWGGSLGRLPVTLEVADGVPQLDFTTKTQSRVQLRKVDEVTFAGTMTNSRGRSYPATLKLVAQGDTEEGTDLAAAGAEPPPPSAAGGKTVYPRDAKIDFVYMGGNDCPPCVAWRSTEFRKLEAAPEFAEMKFHYVVKTVQSPVPVGWLPDAVKPYGDALLEASGGRSGSSQNAFVVNGKIADYWFGSRDADEIVAMVRAIRQGRPLPGAPCLKRTASRACEVRG